MSRISETIGSLAIAGLVAIAFSVAPVGIDNDFTPGAKAAFAKGKGSGKSGSHGGSKHSSKSSSKSSGGGHGVETEDAPGAGHDDDFEAADDESHKEKGELTSAMGNLNAAHASPTALEHASDDSMIGRLRAYVEDFLGDNETTTEEQQDALGAISNKADEDGRVSEEVVTEVNTLLEQPPSE